MENYQLQLLKEFENMDRIPVFEINIAEHLEIDDDEYYIFHLKADEKGIYAGGVTNSGFHQRDNLFIEWDDYFNFYEHLSCIYDKCVRWAIEDFEKSLEV